MSLTHKQSEHHIGAIVSVLAAATLFATGGASRAFADFPGTAMSVAAWRVLLGGLGLLVYARYRYGSAGVKLLFRQPVLWFMGISVLAYQGTFFIGAARIGVAMGTLVALGLAPLLAGLLSWKVGMGKPTRQWAICTAVAVLGLALLTSGSATPDLVGVLWVTISGWSYAAMTVFGVRTVRDLGVSGGEVLAVAFSIGAIFALPVVLLTSDWIAAPKSVMLIVWLGPFATTLAYALFGIGISHLPAGTVSTLTLFEPVMSTTLGVFVLGEAMNLQGWIGCLVIICALGLLGYFESQSKRSVS